MDRAREKPGRIVYAEGTDERVIAAAAEVKKEGIAEPVLIAPRDTVEETAKQAGVSIDGITIIDPKQDERFERFVDEYAEMRSVKTGIAKRLVAKPLVFSGMMVRNGEADGMIAGALHATSLVIQAASLTICPVIYWLLAAGGRVWSF